MRLKNGVLNGILLMAVTAISLTLPACRNGTASSARDAAQKQAAGTLADAGIKASTAASGGPEGYAGEELAAAVSRGLLSKELASDYTRQVTEREFKEMLTAAVRYLGSEPAEALKQQQDIPIDRDRGCEILAETIDGSLLPLTSDGEEAAAIMKKYSAGRFRDNGRGIASEENFLGSSEAPHSLITPLLDLTSNLPLMEMDENYRFRSTAPMTVLEAAQAAYRLTNMLYPEDDFVPLAEAGKASYTEALLEKAERLPDVSSRDFQFRGLVTCNKENGENPLWGLSFMYSRSQAELLADMGFNFTRVPLSFDLLTDGTHQSINMVHLKNMDDFLGWCMENGVHVCFDLHYYPENNEYDLNAMTAFWTMLADRYLEVPSQALSFNVINEPLGEDAQIDALNLACLKAVHASDPDRLVFCDGLTGSNDLGPSKRPSAALAQEDAAQAFHYYYGVFNGDYGLENGGYPAQNTWPYPFVHQQLDQTCTMTVSGDFSAGETLRIRKKYADGAPGFLTVTLDGTEILREPLTDYGESVLHDFEAVLPADGSELVISTSPDCFVWLVWVQLIHKEAAAQPLPFFPPNENISVPEDYSDRRITNILCETVLTEEALKPQHITVEDNGDYTARPISDAPAAAVSYGPEGMADWLRVWTEFRETSGRQCMAQEFGFYCVKTPRELHYRWVDAWLTELEKNKISWNTWDWERLTEQYWMEAHEEVNWVNMHGFWINRDLLAVYQAHMN